LKAKYIGINPATSPSRPPMTIPIVTNPKSHIPKHKILTKNVVIQPKIDPIIIPIITREIAKNTDNNFK